MFTKDFSIFTKMVEVTKEQDLKFCIFYQYSQRKATNKRTEMYTFSLNSELFNLKYKQNLTIEESYVVKSFIQQNQCIEIDEKIDFSLYHILDYLQNIKKFLLKKNN